MNDSYSGRHYNQRGYRLPTILLKCPRYSSLRTKDLLRRLATLSSTELNALLRMMTNAPTAGIYMPSLPPFTTFSTSDTAHICVCSVLERNTGNYSSFLPRNFGACKDASRLPALHAARHALVTIPSSSAMFHYLLLEGWCNHVVSWADDGL